MTLFKRLRHRLRSIKAALTMDPFSPSLWKLALTVPLIAGAEDEKVEIDKAELDRLKREAAESGKSTRKLEKEIEKLKDELEDAKAKAEDASAGDDEAKKLQKQIDREKAKREAAEERVKELEGDIESGNKERTVTAVATRLGFRNPKVALKLLDDDADVSDETAAEKSLKALLKSDPYLKSAGKGQREVTGGADDPDGGDGGDDAKGGGKSNSEGKELKGQALISSAYAQSGKSGDTKE